MTETGVEERQEPSWDGEFELRDWEGVRHVDRTPSAAIASELAGALVSCREARIALSTGRPERVLVAGGESSLMTPVRGELRVDGASFPFEAYISLKTPNEVRGSLDVQKHHRTLGFNLVLRRSRIRGTLFARSASDQPAELQTFVFYRAGGKAPARRTSEAPPPPITVPSPVPPTPVQPTRPQPGPAGDPSAEWAAQLANSRLSRAENDFEPSYGGSSTYVERREVLQLSAQRFLYERLTTSRVSYAGLTSPSSKHVQMAGTWTVHAVSGALRARLVLAADDGQELTFIVGRPSGASILVDGTDWRWSRM